MAAGILSVAAGVEGQPQLSQILLASGLVAFGLTIARDVRFIASGIGWDEGTAVLTLFTWVAACGLFGERVGDALPFARVVFALMAVAGFVAALIALKPLLASASPPASWSVTGSWLLAVVALQSLSIALTSMRIRLLAELGAGIWAAGLATYAVLIALILRRLVRRKGRPEARPDYWITMGALAISTVAAAASPRLSAMAPAVWICAAAWIPYLCVMEAAPISRRRLQFCYDPLRWSTVFPIGMFSLATHDLGLGAIGSAFFWLGLALSLLNLVAWTRARLVS
jgi:tellurite resistance protein TehA-like permease